MLSSQMLWPRLWSNCVAFIVSPLFNDRFKMREFHRGRTRADWRLSSFKSPQPVESCRRTTCARLRANASFLPRGRARSCGPRARG